MARSDYTDPPLAAGTQYTDAPYGSRRHLLSGGSVPWLQVIGKSLALEEASRMSMMF